MIDEDLEGTCLPDGEYTVEPWKAFLWADATRNDDDAFRYDEAAEAAGMPGQLAPYSLCQHIAFEATGGIEATMGRLSDNWTEGAALGQLRVDFHSSILVDKQYHVSGYISNVERKEGSSGDLTIITQAYEVTTTEGDPVYDMEADMVLMGDA